MLGWNIRVYRLAAESLGEIRTDAEGIRVALTGDSPEAQPMGRGEPIAVWQTRSGGLGWIKRIVEEGRGLSFLQGGYPDRYVIRSRDLVQQILQGLPDENEVWSSGPHDVLLPHWLGKTTIDEDALRSCEPDEWLLAEAWDES